MSASVPTMPEWVTALEAAVLTGASEIVVLDAVRSGRLQANPLSMGKGSSGVLLVRLRDVQALIEETSRPAAPALPAPSPFDATTPPVSTPPAAPVAPTTRSSGPRRPPRPAVRKAAPATAPAPGRRRAEPSGSTPPSIWNELTDTAATSVTPPPVARPPRCPRSPSLRPPVRAASLRTAGHRTRPIRLRAVLDAGHISASGLRADRTSGDGGGTSRRRTARRDTRVGSARRPPAAPAPVPTAPFRPHPFRLSSLVARTRCATRFGSARRDTAGATSPRNRGGRCGADPPRPPLRPRPRPASGASARRRRSRLPRSRPRREPPAPACATRRRWPPPSSHSPCWPRPCTSPGRAPLDTTIPGSPAASAPAPPSVVWMIPTSHGDQIAVVGLPNSAPAVAIAVPSESHVILPAGDISTVGVSANSGPRAQAVAQNVLLKRVGHYLVTSPANFGKLVRRPRGHPGPDRGAVHVRRTPDQPGQRQDEGRHGRRVPFPGEHQRGDRPVGGPARGCARRRARVVGWATVGESDDPVVVSRLLAASTRRDRARDADGAGLRRRDRGRPRRARPRCCPSSASSLGSLVRIVVVNGSGAPGLGTAIDGKLAPYGFSVVTSENASRFNVKRTHGRRQRRSKPRLPRRSRRRSSA